MDNHPTETHETIMAKNPEGIDRKEPEAPAALQPVVEWAVADHDRQAAELAAWQLHPVGFAVLDQDTLEKPQPGTVLLRFYPEPGSAEDLLQAVETEAQRLARNGELSAPGRVRLRTEPAVDWVARVRAGFEPFRVGRFHVRPPWTEPDPNALDLCILPGAAFGTGRHPTTRLCLLLLDQFAAGGAAPARILDLGCGSGILALAAARLWPEAEILAVDNDPAALENARENIAAAGLEHAIQVADPRVLSDAGPFDLLVANIRLPVLVRLAPDFPRLLVRGGHLLLSGLLQDERHAMLEALDQAGGAWQLTRSLAEEEWEALLLHRTGTRPTAAPAAEGGSP